MSDFTQLSLFDNPDDLPKVSTPEDLAQQGYIRRGPDGLSAAIDAVMWARDEDYATAQESYENYLKRIRADSTSVKFTGVQIKARAADGKMRKTDFLTPEQMLRLAQEIPGKKSGKIKDWLARVGAERIEESQHVGLGSFRARKRDLDLLKSQGYSRNEALQHLETRVDTMSTFKSLTEAISKVCEAPNYPQIINAEYSALFGMIASELKILLNTDSIRDKLPTLQLSYLRTAEFGLQALVKQQDRMTNAQILLAVQTIVVPLGEHLQTVSQLLGIHHITGQPLLQA